MKIEEPVAERLLAENEAFRRLWVQHQRYEQQLADLDRLHHLLPDQELERRTIQKLKLAGKDKMAAIVREETGR
ncbi:MAG: DUF465 domain-containing protein [Candidatus Methylomirabilia bacterium]